jgi:hypothetical protein
MAHHATARIAPDPWVQPASFCACKQKPVCAGAPNRRFRAEAKRPARLICRFLGRRENGGALRVGGGLRMRRDLAARDIGRAPGPGRPCTRLRHDGAPDGIPPAKNVSGSSRSQDIGSPGTERRRGGSIVTTNAPGSSAPPWVRLSEPAPASPVMSRRDVTREITGSVAPDTRIPSSGRRSRCAGPGRIPALTPPGRRAENTRQAVEQDRKAACALRS